MKITKESRTTFVVYDDGFEILVTTPELEKEMLKNWFGRRGHRPLRDRDTYERTEINQEAVSVTSKGLRAEW